VRVNIAIPEAQVTKPVLDGALEAVTRLNEQLLAEGSTPTSHQLIEQGARWQPEKPGDEHFDHGALIAQRGHGDCDDWAPLHAATLRATGEDPGAIAVVKKSGPKRWHAIVERSDGTIDDPSLAAGMPDPARRVGVRGAWLPSMWQRRPSTVSGSYIAQPQLALRPIADRDGQPEAWQARADLPWHWGPPGSAPLDVAMASLHASPVSDQAVVGALRGVYRLGVAGGCAHPEDLERVAAIADACDGATWEDLAREYGPDHATAAGAVVGSFFGKALRRIGKVAKGAVRFAAPALSLIPGGSLATAAFNAARSPLKHSVLKQHHLPPEQRGPAPARVVVPRSAPVQRSPRAEHCEPHQIINYFGVAPPATAAEHSPGAAWPPRR
jgi:hypothetical protein